MSTSHKVKLIDVIELSCHFSSEEPAGSTWGHCPCVNIFGVGPHQIGEGALMWHFHSAVNQSDLVQSLHLRGEATMDAEDFALDDGSNAQVVENVGAVLPGVHVSVLAHGFLVEAVDRGDASCLVVTTQQGDALRVLQLEAKEQLESLNRVVASVDEVTHEDVAGVGDLATFVKQFEQVMELAMDVATNGHRGTHRLHIALFDQDFLYFLAEDAKITLRQNTSVLDSGKP